jgi:hypothetical protein
MKLPIGADVDVVGDGSGSCPRRERCRAGSRHLPGSATKYRANDAGPAACIPAPSTPKSIASPIAFRHASSGCRWGVLRPDAFRLLPVLPDRIEVDHPIERAAFADRLFTAWRLASFASS